MQTPLLDGCKKDNIELYNLVYPKAYQYIPANYVSPKQFAENVLVFVSQLMSDQVDRYVQEGDNEATLKALASFLDKARPYRLPSFFVDRDFYQAMIKTDIKQGIDFNNISLPFPCQLLYLPNNIDEEYKIYEGDTDSVVQIIGISKYNTTTENTQYIYFHTAEKYIRFVAKGSSQIEDYIEKSSIGKGFKLALNILMARIARPNLYSNGTKLKPSGKKSIRELRKLNYLRKMVHTLLLDCIEEEDILETNTLELRMQNKRLFGLNQH